MTRKESQQKYFLSHREELSRRRRDRRAALNNHIGYELTKDGWRKSKLPKLAIQAYRNNWAAEKRRREGVKPRKWLTEGERKQARREKEKLKRNDGSSFKLKQNLKCLIRNSLRAFHHKKQSKTSELLGCSIEHLRVWLTFYFQIGMTWKNYGSAWHIDHIRPCASFDFSDVNQQKECFHYTNLQPLFAVDNIKKGAKYYA